MTLKRSLILLLYISFCCKTFRNSLTKSDLVENLSFWDKSLKHYTWGCWKEIIWERKNECKICSYISVIYIFFKFVIINHWHCLLRWDSREGVQSMADWLGKDMPLILSELCRPIRWLVSLGKLSTAKGTSLRSCPLKWVPENIYTFSIAAHIVNVYKFSGIHFMHCPKNIDDKICFFKEGF